MSQEELSDHLKNKAILGGSYFLPHLLSFYLQNKLHTAFRGKFSRK